MIKKMIIGLIGLAIGTKIVKDRIEDYKEDHPDTDEERAYKEEKKENRHRRIKDLLQTKI